MRTLDAQTLDAKILLGDTGEVERIAAFALVYPTPTGPGWVVRAVCGGAAEEITGFLGPTARARAMEYAGEKYSGVRVFDAPPT